MNEIKPSEVYGPDREGVLRAIDYLGWKVVDFRVPVLQPDPETYWGTQGTVITYKSATSRPNIIIGHGLRLILQRKETSNVASA